MSMIFPLAFPLVLSLLLLVLVILVFVVELGILGYAYRKIGVPAATCSLSCCCPCSAAT